MGLKLTEKYPHLKFIEEANNEADEAREEVEFWEEDNIRLTFGNELDWSLTETFNGFIYSSVSSVD